MPEEPEQPDTDADADAYTVALDESRRAIDQQREDLRSIRDRAASLLTVAGIAAAFLGGLALRDEQARLGFWTFVAAFAFIGIAGIVIAILWPRSITFAQHPQTVVSWIEAYGADTSKVSRDLALHHGRHFDANRAVLEGLTVAYQVAVGLLPIELLALTFDLRGR
jgi:hypothetical protein